MNGGIPGFLKGPNLLVGRCYCEHWEHGRFADRRIRQLRKLCRDVKTRSYELSSRWTAPLGALSQPRRAVEITYFMLHGFSIPEPIVDAESIF